MSAIWAAPSSGLLRDAQLFDVYRPKVVRDVSQLNNAVERSLAVRLTLNSDDATLSEEQIEGVMKAIVDELTTRIGARLRV
jgi:phenylalanyl-tRNA synthetase beta chain